MLIEKGKKILEKNVCDHCLGRQFAKLLHGYSNDERGRIIRTAVAMSMDKEDVKEVPEGIKNFSFNRADIKKQQIKRKKCELCNNFFERIDELVEKIVKKLDGLEFKTFLVGTRLPFELIKKEEELWEQIGIDDCEPLKAEINREVGKRLEKKLRARADLKNPDICILINVPSRISIRINPLFIYGEYNKLKRGIPQTKWPDKKYKTSVEEIIAKPFMKATKGRGHKLHGMGREDIDALCLGWRPFVLEILEPKKRFFNPKQIGKRIGKSVKVRKLRFSSIDEVRKIKEKRTNKTYKIIVKCNGIKKSDLKKLSLLVGEISQQTPLRVVHRRADIRRKRKVIKIKSTFINKNKFVLYVTAEAGLYVKELVSGDNGRTKPNVSELLGTECICEKLDVIKIEK